MSMSDTPLCIDLYGGLGGWAEGFLAEGWRVRGYDIEAHDYGTGGYPGELVLRDILTLHGQELKDAYVIVGSSPCQKYSYMAMPWKRAKAMVAYYEDKDHPERLEELNALFNAQFRIQREASEAAGRYIPMVVENVRGAQRWVGCAKCHYGSFYLWGDVPALMPNMRRIKNSGGSWFNIGSPGQKVVGQNPDGRLLNIRDGYSCTRHLTNPAEHVLKVAMKDDEIGNKMGGDWFSDPSSTCRLHASKSKGRKAASAMIAKIPFPLASHIARAYKPQTLHHGGKP